MSYDGRPHWQIPAPVSRPTGLGDVIAGIAKALGIVKPCEPCQERQRQYNQRVQFVPPGYDPRRYR